MDMRKYSGSSFLKADDVRAASLRERIASISEGKFGKPVITFESGRRLSLNVTNNKVLIRAYGEDSDTWIGCDVELRLGDVEVQGELKEIVRVEPLSPKLPLAAAQATHRSRPIPF
jgi:hypothetical protein